MEIDEIRIFALSLPDTEECFPFGENSLVLKTKGKIFIILDLMKIHTQQWLHFSKQMRA
jgi:predicted DNA-binding protein (MmcQ/YjbR family)